MEILSRIQQILNALHLCGAESPAAARNKMLMETTHRSKQRASRNKTDELSKQCDIKSSRHLADWFALMNGLYGRELGIHRGVVKIQSIEELDEALAHPNKRAVQTIKMVSCPDEKISKLISAFNHGNLSILELCSCNFHAFPPNICFLSSLTELSLCQNSIMFLHADLSHLCRLQLLNISQNRLLSLSPLLLTLHDLRALDVSHNQIQSIAYGLESLSHLKLFCCSSNRISIVPIGLICKPSFEIQFADNPILFPPENIMSQGAVAVIKLSTSLLNVALRHHLQTEADLSGLQLYSIPHILQPGILHASDFVNIKLVDLSHNLFDTAGVSTSIDSHLPIFNSVSTLILDYNLLLELPQLTSAVDFSSLSFRCNSISGLIPERISSQANLTELFLSSNRISEIPETLTLLKSLKFIELHGNPIREVQISLSIAIESSSLDGTIDSFYLQFPNVSCPSFSSLCDKFGKAEYTFREIITSVCSIARKTSMHLTLPSLGIAVTPHAKLFHKQQTRIDISNNLVCDLNASLFSTDCCLTDINFSHNKLSNTLVFDNFSSLVKLQCLNLSNNQFTKYILHHSSVVRIDLSHNSIEVVPIEAFDSWTSLIYADFSHNPLHQFGDVSNKVDINTWYDMVFQDQEVFAHKQLPLESLILENTGIFGCIPTVFARLRALQKLDISGTYISDLPPAFWRVFEDLTPETANFNRCPLSHLSVQIFESFFLDKFSEDSELDARRAILQNGLPRGFQASQILDCCAAAEKSLHLECSHMDLTNLPKPCLIMNLTTMDISWNHLLNLPPEIFCMTNLKSLNISKNDIAVLSENISKLSNLHFLDIHDTNITELPYSLALLPSLHTVIWHPAELTRFEIQHKTTLDQDQLPPRIPPASVFFGGWTHSKLFMMQIIDSQKNQTLELCGISLQVLPRELARFELSGSIIELTLNNCLLQELPGWFSRFSVLTHLDVSNNKLSRLPDNFSVLTSICHLDLSSNPIAEAFPAASALTNIVFLNLGTTQIDLLHPSISHLIRLRTLSLQHTKLSVIPSFISVLNCLQALLLDGCPLSSISWAIGRCSSLRELQCKSCSSVIETPHRYYVNLGSSELLAYMKLLCQAQESGAISIMHTNLESFPEEIAEIVQLKSLTLLGINIKRVLQSIGHLKNLEELSVAQNVLPFLPNEIGQLKQLQELDVSSNLLTSLPDSLGNCKFLTSMQLSHNKFQEWPPCMFELVSIQMLSFSNNQLELVPEGISKLTTLQQLFLQKNSLLTVSWAVQGLQNLETIDLSHNYLSTISVYFGACPRLRRFRRVDLPLLEMKFSRMHALSDRDFIIQLREMYAEYAVQNSTKLKW